MKITKIEFERFASIISTACSAGIDSLVIQQYNGYPLASGLTGDRSCSLITINTPYFGQTLGLTRLSVLKDRVNLFLGLDATLDAKEHERGEISQLDFSAGKSKMTYRASASSLIKAPKSIEDEPVGICRIKYTQWETIVRAVKSMKAKQLCLVLKDSGEVTFEAADEATTDKVSISVDNLDILNPTFESAVHYLPSDLLFTMARASVGDIDKDTEVIFSVGEGGTVKMIVNDCEISIMAIINSED